MKLIITRHGQTEENKKGILQGHLDGTLSALGIEQAKMLAKRLEREHIDVIYTSDLARAHSTAKEIALHHASVPFIVTQELREVDIGSHTGKLETEVDFNNLPDDHEGNERLFHRAQRFIQFLQSKHMRQTVLCVAHGRLNAAMLSVLTGLNHDQIDTIPMLHNTSVNILELNEQQQWELRLMNCIRHLEDPKEFV